MALFRHQANQSRVWTVGLIQRHKYIWIQANLCWRWSKMIQLSELVPEGFEIRGREGKGWGPQAQAARSNDSITAPMPIWLVLLSDQSLRLNLAYKPKAPWGLGSKEYFTRRRRELAPVIYILSRCSPDLPSCTHRSSWKSLDIRKRTITSQFCFSSSLCDRISNSSTVLNARNARFCLGYTLPSKGSTLRILCLLNVLSPTW